MSEKTKSFKQLFMENVVWFITTIAAIGAFATTVKFQGEAIAEVSKSVVAVKEGIIANDKEHVKYDGIRSDIREMKEDIKEIKKIILKPAIP